MTAKSTASDQSKSSFSREDFAKALMNYDYEFEKGQTVKGIVSQHTSEGAYVDIGGKSSALVPLREADIESDINLADCLPLQAEMEFLIISEQNADGQVTLSRRQLLLEKAWENVTAISEKGQSVQIRITGINKGGVTGDVEGLRGFIPRSHLVEKEDLDSLVGQLLHANFIQVDQENNKLVLSQRQLVQAAAMSQLVVGSLQEGKIVKIQPYGVFVDCKGVTGLLHIKQISGAHIDSIATLFKVGQPIKVVVTDIDEYKNRVSLSTKVLESYPGEILEQISTVMENAAERLQQAQETASS
jgi:small subunit ribosomal protein S1